MLKTGPRLPTVSWASPSRVELGTVPSFFRPYRPNPKPDPEPNPDPNQNPNPKPDPDTCPQGGMLYPPSENEYDEAVLIEQEPEMQPRCRRDMPPRCEICRRDAAETSPHPTHPQP